MKKIASFRIDHTKLGVGIYLNRVNVCQGLSVAVTYDIRMCAPYNDEPMPRDAMHTIEHIGATYLRNHKKFGNNIIYFGPMGCATGFYLIVQPMGMIMEDVIELLHGMFKYIAKFPSLHKKIPGATKKECGNYKLHWLAKAAGLARDFLEKCSWELENYPS